MGWKVVIAPSALSDLEEIVRYIAGRDSAASARLGHELVTRAENLASFPESGRTVPEFRDPDLREVICRSYRVIYRLRKKAGQIDVIRFWHGARGFPQVPTGGGGD